MVALERATPEGYEGVKPQIAVSQASGSVMSLSRLINDAEMKHLGSFREKEARIGFSWHATNSE
jgi:hypothetical protein